jgi:hypothetical protein
MSSGRDVVATQFCDALLPGFPTVSWVRVHSFFSAPVTYKRHKEAVGGAGAWHASRPGGYSDRLR